MLWYPPFRSPSMPLSSAFTSILTQQCVSMSEKQRHRKAKARLSVLLALIGLALGYAWIWQAQKTGSESVVVHRRVIVAAGNRARDTSRQTEFARRTRSQLNDYHERCRVLSGTLPPYRTSELKFCRQRLAQVDGEVNNAPRDSRFSERMMAETRVVMESIDSDLAVLERESRERPQTKTEPNPGEL